MGFIITIVSSFLIGTDAPNGAVAPGDIVHTEAVYENTTADPITAEVYYNGFDGVEVSLGETTFLPGVPVVFDVDQEVAADATENVAFTWSYKTIGFGLSNQRVFGITSPADVERSGRVGIEDLVNVILRWGSDDVLADVNGDGVVDTEDLIEVVRAWG